MLRRLPLSVGLFDYKWFQNLQSGSRSRRSEGFKRRNIFNISSIESLGPTQKLGLRGGFETTSNEKRDALGDTPLKQLLADPSLRFL